MWPAGGLDNLTIFLRSCWNKTKNLMTTSVCEFNPECFPHKQSWSDGVRRFSFSQCLSMFSDEPSRHKKHMKTDLHIFPSCFGRAPVAAF
uniref:Uncharacterized protein n=1 Tax=Ixodes ricinus TaxID=34613 RepID=A0A6B0U6W2_IXORI